MGAVRNAGFLLIAAGVLALIYGGFTYTRANHETTLGPMEFSVKHNQTVEIPVWAGVAGIVLGGLLVLGTKKA